MKRYAALLSITEIGLGGLMHAFHLPLAGHILSLNQGAILTFAVKRALSRRSAIQTSVEVSGLAAALKSLSPAGKKLTPMLAIAVQGLLYAIGIAIAGRNVFGAALGVLFLSTWSYLQPLLLAWAIFGSDLFLAVRDLWFKAAEYFHIPSEYGLAFLFSLVCIKLVSGIFVGILAWHIGSEAEELYTKQLGKFAPKKAEEKPGSPLLLALKDLATPWFVVSLSISLVGFACLRDASRQAILFYAVRAITLGYLCFWLIRAVPHLQKLRRYAERNLLRVVPADGKADRTA